MNIGYDFRPFLSEETGIGVYIRNITRQIIETNPTDFFYLFSSSFSQRFLRHHLPKSNNYIFKDFRIPGSLLNFCWYRLGFPPFGLFFMKKPDLVHSPLPIILPGRHKNIITVHDLCMFDHPSMVMPETIRYFRNQLGNSLDKTDGIIAVSEFTRSRLLSLFGAKYASRIRVIYHGSDLETLTSRPPAIPLPEKYLLYVGTIEPRKNLGPLIAALADLNKFDDSIRLVISGKRGWAYQEFLQAMEKNGVRKQVMQLDYVTREELKFLYQHAALLVMPSHYEGFGLPILEAAYCGLPVACSDIPVFREIFADYPLYFNRENPGDIAAKIGQLLEDDQLYQEKIRHAENIKQKYTWPKAARQTRSFYQEVCL